MKKFLLGTVGLVALGMAAPASAADLAARPYTKAPPPYIEPMYNWSGFYIGINGGWGQSRKTFDILGFGEGFSADATGGTFGGQIGYNWQAGSWVFGLEAQGNWADLSRSFIDPFDTRFSVGSKVDALGLFTGRVGYAANNALFYVKGGAAVASNKYFAAFNGVDFIDVSNTRWGADLGVGFEWGFTPNWSFGVEYNHAFLGNNDFNWANNRIGWTNVNVKQDIDLVTARINYRFGGPVVARY
jgi:outer membrane immunogenic protein